jgi:hypothetical protein
MEFYFIDIGYGDSGKPKSIKIDRKSMPEFIQSRFWFSSGSVKLVTSKLNNQNVDLIGGGGWEECDFILIPKNKYSGQYMVVKNKGDYDGDYGISVAIVDQKEVDELRENLVLKKWMNKKDSIDERYNEDGDENKYFKVTGDCRSLLIGPEIWIFDLSKIEKYDEWVEPFDETYESAEWEENSSGSTIDISITCKDLIKKEDGYPI